MTENTRSDRQLLGRVGDTGFDPLALAPEFDQLQMNLVGGHQVVGEKIDQPALLRVEVCQFVIEVGMHLSH
ncbi:hypothetical protein [Nocardia nova]|uniref:hypothetical protein n=1 Tax=Nocardia nova TaxID=37330 RepID=UPI002157C94E|nr:hypothetical protein [Nocardia nova]